jgi:hypothetical protein
MAPRIERKLAAILAADVVGYSRLVWADEAGTIARLKALRKESIEPLIGEHHGRIGKAEEGAGFADRALRLDPRMTPANLSGAKDAYYMARRYEDTIDAVMRMPEEHRGRDSWVMLVGSYARSGRTTDAAGAKAKLLQAFPNVSAERVVNEDYVYARQEDEDFFVEGFRIAGLPVCMTVEEIAKYPATKPRPECQAERAKAVAARS